MSCLESAGRLGSVAGRSVQNDIGNYESTGDGIFLVRTSDILNPWMAVDDRFHFLGMHFQAADVDDPIAPANEVVAIPAQFEYIACIHKALRILERAAVFAQITERSAR